MLNYDNQRKANLILTYTDLKQSYSLIKDNETYDFMNEIFGSDSVLTDSMELTKIQCLSIAHSKDLWSFIKGLPDSIASSSEKKNMKKQLTYESLLWDNSKLKNCWILTPNDLSKIRISDSTDYWEEFRRLFGKYGKHNYSKPIFNSDYTVAVIKHSGQGGWLMGSGEIYVFIRIKGEWVFYLERNLWIS